MSKPTREQKLKSAYDFWKENPFTLVDELVIKFKTNKKDLGTYLKDNNLSRPDGRIIGKDSPRQQAIKASYEAALKAGETPGWAERYARDKFGAKTNKGDYRYYGMKNELPPLREVGAMRQESPHKINL